MKEAFGIYDIGDSPTMFKTRSNILMGSSVLSQIVEEIDSKDNNN